MISVPIIILDTRDESSALAAERRIIHERRLYWKLVIVTQPGRSEDHFSNDLLAGEQIAWITPEDLPDTIFSSIVLRRRLPTQSHPAGPMLRPPGHDQRGPIGEA